MLAGYASPSPNAPILTFNVPPLSDCDLGPGNQDKAARCNQDKSLRSLKEYVPSKEVDSTNIASTGTYYGFDVQGERRRCRGLAQGACPCSSAAAGACCN